MSRDPFIDPLTGNLMDLDQKVCHMEGGAKSVDIAQVNEVLRVLADLFVNDPTARMQFWESYERQAMKRHDKRLVREALAHHSQFEQTQVDPPRGAESDPED